MKNYEFGLPITSLKFSFIFVNLICFGDHISVRKVKILSTHCMKCILLKLPSHWKAKWKPNRHKKEEGNTWANNVVAPT
jgi:hypothetical protein